MNLTRDRQGFLEDVSSMTLSQLKELLERQENILSKKKFVANLPDKGEKSRQFAEKLRELIVARNRGNVDSNRLRLMNENIQRFPDKSTELVKDTDKTTIETLLTRNETDIAYTSDANDSTDTNLAGDLAQRMQELTVGSGPIKDTQSPSTNSYERVIKKVEQNPFTTKTKFLPNRSKKEKSSSYPPPRKMKVQSTKIQEESAVYPPQYSHESTKLISVEESIQLIQEQRVKAEQLAAERAAQRLAEHFTSKMEPYQPPSIDMKYRQSNDNDDDDDGDDNEDNDYGDNDDDDKDVQDNDQDSDDIPSDEDDVDNGL